MIWSHSLWRAILGWNMDPFATYFEVHQKYRVLTHSQRVAQKFRSQADHRLESAPVTRVKHLPFGFLGDPNGCGEES